MLLALTTRVALISEAPPISSALESRHTIYMTERKGIAVGKSA